MSGAFFLFQTAESKAENMCSQVSGFCMILFLLFFTLSSASARPVPAAYIADHPATQQLDVGEAEKVQAVEDSCDGIEEEECLMRRTLAAHIDYIYTQKSKP